MTALRPCLDCGTPAAGPRCPEHTVTDTRTNRTHVAWRNDAKWKNLSKRLRKAQPWCSQCSTTVDLTVDHIVPVSQAPELAYAVENCDVLCRSCNGRRGNQFTLDEAHGVLNRLEREYKRRPTTTGRARINAAQHVIETWGDTPNGQPFRPAVRQSLCLTPEGGGPPC